MPEVAAPSVQLVAQAQASVAVKRAEKQIRVFIVTALEGDTSQYRWSSARSVAPSATSFPGSAGQGWHGPMKDGDLRVLSPFLVERCGAGLGGATWKKRKHDIADAHDDDEVGR